MITTALIDLRSDTGRQLLNKIAGKYRCPAYVLAASVDDMSTPEPGNETKFAAYNPTASLPYWSPAATWVSYAYLREQQGSIPQQEYTKIAGRLRTAADHWGITADLDAIDGTEARLVKEASESAERYPVRNAKEAAAAREFLLAQLSLPRSERTISCDDRIKLAGVLVDHGCTDEPLVRASCRVGCYDSRKVAKLLRTALDNRDTSQPATPTDLAARLSSAVAAMPPAVLQRKQAQLAVFADEAGLFEQPAELALSVNTVDPVVVMSNGSVVKTAHLVDMPDEIYGLFRANAEEFSFTKKTADWTKLASQVPTSVADEFITHLESLGHRCEVSGIASFSGSVLDATKLFNAAQQS